MGLEVAGVEISRVPEPYWKWRGIEKRVKVGRAEKLPFPDRSFDTVYSSHVIEHSRDIRKAIRESVRVARQRAIHVIPDGSMPRPGHRHDLNRVSFRKLLEGMKLDFSIHHVPSTHINSLMAVINCSR